MLHDLEARSIDFTLAFPQANLDVDVYMELPPGFDKGGNLGSHIIKLNKLLHGLCQSSHNWWNLLKSSLEARGYDNQSATDPYVYIGKESVVLHVWTIALSFPERIQTFRIC